MISPFKSSYVVIRAIAWFVLFLLFLGAWLVWEAHFPISKAYVVLKKVGLDTLASTILLVFIPPTLPTLLVWLAWRKPASSVTTEESLAQTPVEASSPPLTTLRIGAWSALTPFGDVTTTLDGTKKKQTVFKLDTNVVDADEAPFLTARLGKLPSSVFADLPQQEIDQEDVHSPLARTKAMLLIVLNALHDKKEELNLDLPKEEVVQVIWLPPTENNPNLALTNEDLEHAFTSVWQHSEWNTTAYSLALLAEKNTYEFLHAAQHSSANSTRPITLMLTADSLLNPEEVELLIGQNKLYSATTKTGIIPSEGAAGLMLMDASYIEKMDLSHFNNLSTLGELHLVEREFGDPTETKINCTHLTACINNALSASQTSKEQIGSIVSDTDHQLVAQGLEINEAMHAVFPEHRPQSRLNPMEYAGNFGKASDLIHLALAAESAQKTEQAVLIIRTADAKQNAAGVVLPAVTHRH